MRNVLPRKFVFLPVYLAVLFGLFFGTIFTPKASAISANSISVNVSPENPAPNQDVTVTLSSYSANLDTVMITWYVDGKNSASGVGKKTFYLKAPASGSTVVRATMAFPDGSVDTSVTIRPSVMVLLWQADDSYVPPFYKGKALPGAESEVKVVAMPEIKSGTNLVSPLNMTYTWQKDYNNDAEDSGYAKNSMTYINDYLDSTNNISVTASTLDQQNNSQASIDIGEADPQILFYRSDAKLGTLWDNALGDTFSISGNEILEASPYFLSPKEVNHPRLIWNWSINDNIVSVPTYNPNFLPLKIQPGTSGISNIKLQIKNKDKIFENASKEINIEF